MIDESHFQDALDADPADHGMRLVFADWLAERGDERADGYMWLGLRRKWPYVCQWRQWWGKDMSEPRHCMLPISMTEMIDFGLWYSFPFRRAAEDAFARAYPALVASHPRKFRLNLEAVA